MEQIAMAAIPSQPATDAKPSAAGGVEAKAGRLFSLPCKRQGAFDMMMALELEKLSGSIKEMPKKLAGAGDPLVAWLMAALAQGFRQSMEQGQPAQAEGNQENPQTIDTIPANLPGAQSETTIPADAAASLMQWIAANPELFQGILEDYKAGATPAGGLVQSLGKLLRAEEGTPGTAASMTARQETEFIALLQSLTPEDGQAMEASPANGNGKAVVEELRRLFAEAVAARPAGQDTANAVPQTMDQPDHINPVLTAQPEAAATEGRAAQPELSPIGAAPAKDANSIPAAAGQGKDTAGAPTAEGNDAPETDDGFSRQKEQLPFPAAFRAYQAEATVVPAAQGEAAAVRAAARPGAEAFDSIVQSITGLKDSAAREMQIQLKPEFLGKVTIHLAMEEGGLVARIAAANPKVQDAFLNQAATLQAVLADQGLKDVRVVVTSSSVQDPGLQQQADRRSQHQQHQQKRSRLPAQGVESAAAPALRAYEALTVTGAINYLA